jgi:hypothetical protein
MAAELNRLETAAAVLERDVRNGRAMLIERGLNLAPQQQRTIDWENAFLRSAHNVVAAWFSATGAVQRLVRTVSPYVALTFRIAKRCVIEGALSCAIAVGSLAATTLAILMLAPPD